MRLVLAALLFISLNAFADDPPFRYGPEFTFPNKNEFPLRYMNRLVSHLQEGQPDGEKFTATFPFHETPERDDPAIFKSPHGWSFDVSTDNEVIEIQMPPMALKDWKALQRDIQDAIFVSAYNENGFPELFLGGGHINIDMEPFWEQPLLLRNFIADYWNHNELAMGIWNYDTHNGLALAQTSQMVINKVRAAFRTFDEEYKTVGKLSKDERKAWLIVFLDSLHSARITRDRFLRLWDSSGNRSRSEVDINLFGTNVGNRFEIRAVRPQKDVYTWINQLSLIEGRLNFLNKLSKPIPLGFQVPIVNKGYSKSVALNPPVNPQIALRNFYRYVNESGEKWENHRDYIWPEWITNGELKKFENSDWFKNRECAGGLE